MTVLENLVLFLCLYPFLLHRTFCFPHCCLVAKSCLTLCDPMVARQPPLSMGFPRQEYWNGFPFPSPGDLPDPGTEPMSPASPALAGRFFTTAPPGKVVRILTTLLRIRYLHFPLHQAIP